MAAGLVSAAGGAWSSMAPHERATQQAANNGMAAGIDMHCLL